jgi:hypothetical protein
MAVMGFTEEQPRSQYNGNFRHFFGAAREDLFTGQDIVVEVRRIDKENPDRNPLKKSLIMHLDKISAKLIKLCKHKNMNLFAEFQKLDPKKKSTQIAFKIRHCQHYKIRVHLGREIGN